MSGSGVAEMACGEGQVKICGMKMDSISEKLDGLALDLQAQKVLEESHAKEMFGKIDHLSDLISGGGRAGTGISPRLSMVELKSENNDKGLARVELKLDGYIKERTAFERKLTWGIITAIGTACLGILTQFVGGKL